LQLLKGTAALASPIPTATDRAQTSLTGCVTTRHRIVVAGVKQEAATPQQCAPKPKRTAVTLARSRITQNVVPRARAARRLFIRRVARREARVVAGRGRLLLAAPAIRCAAKRKVTEWYIEFRDSKIAPARVSPSSRPKMLLERLVPLPPLHEHRLRGGRLRCQDQSPSLHQELRSGLLQKSSWGSVWDRGLPESWIRVLLYRDLAEWQAHVHQPQNLYLLYDNSQYVYFLLFSTLKIQKFWK
jgi:hypothetical protein